MGNVRPKFSAKKHLSKYLQGVSMDPVLLLRNVSGLLLTSIILILGLFINFVRNQDVATIFGFNLPSQTLHLALGPILLLINCAILYFMMVLFLMPINAEQVIQMQNLNPMWLLGPIVNPLYVSNFSVVNSFGYAVLIILWWLAMHTFWFSIRLNSSSPFIAAWDLLFGGLFLLLGLSSMIVVQSLFYKLGLDYYQLKIRFSFVGIAIGAFLPPFILGISRGN
jgi:hypothetical protein